ncbi:O-methyltransferase [Flaviflexus salsibiostraticola]|uniref:O-methyltransferase n=1 Tax=Flaviflexus salsibiostraticola TaxID=1282737 RepID=A0A3Q8WTA5_9ACTO|nr:O-methyltransferase [Flaviflexus salsibiostraticola]AZN29652.1 O-methyltransferase [Flaviflexus salsibiostraticola]
MASDKTLSWAYSEEQTAEDQMMVLARAAAEDLGVSAVSPATGALLRLLVSISHSRTAVEVGTGAGVSGLYLLLGNPDLTLTTIDVEAEAQRSAREVFSRAGIRASRTRLIKGRSADILPRLADRSYDLVLVDGDPEEAPGDAEEALRILRPGGLLVIARALLDGRVADPARREPETVAIRGLVRDVLDRSPLSSLLPVGSGLLLAQTQS